jgi:hypothetical protein
MRRRGFGIGRPFRALRRALTPDVPPEIAQANKLLMNGDYVNAAPAFENLARRAEGRGGPRAPMFFIQAGRAHILNQQVEKGMINLRSGLSLLASTGRMDALQRAGSRIVRELDQLGLAGEARIIRELLSKQNITVSAQFPQTETPTRLLPTHCPSCGAPVRSDEVEWIDAATAECDFCGGAIRAE